MVRWGQEISFFKQHKSHSGPETFNSFLEPSIRGSVPQLPEMKATLMPELSSMSPM